MNIPQAVILDLLPLYFSDEASTETRALVDDYLAAHPDFARVMRASQKAAPVMDAPRADAGVQAMGRVRQMLRRRAALQALAIFCTLAPLSFTFGDGQLTWMMWRDAPLAALAYAIGAVVSWGLFLAHDRRINGN